MKLNPNNKKTKQEIWNKDFVCNYCGSHAIPSHKAGCRFCVSTYNKKKVQPLQVNEKIGGWEEQFREKFKHLFDIYYDREIPGSFSEGENLMVFISSQLTLAEERGRKEFLKEIIEKIGKYETPMGFGSASGGVMQSMILKYLKEL